MTRTSTFYEFTPTTKAKWERIARRVAAHAHYEARADDDRSWTKDEVIEHIRIVLAEDGEELDERRGGMYLERMRMASVFSGPDIPTLDLEPTNGNGMGYRWIRDGRIPGGFLRHILSITGATPRIAFDYFTLMSADYDLNEMIDAVGAANAMLLLLMAEYYIRVKRVENTPQIKLLDQYLEIISRFKKELQGKITRAEADGLIAMGTALLPTRT